jgi:glycosyltransferase involved in cell wall biosynthesis
MISGFRRVAAKTSRGGLAPTVAFVGHSAAMSGAEIAMLRGMRALRGHIRPVFILAEDGPLVGALEADGVSVIVLPMGDGVRTVRRRELSGLGAAMPMARNAWRMLRYAWELRTLLRQAGADIVHVYTMKSVVYGGVAGRLARVPVVWHLHNRIASDWLPAPAVLVMRGLSYVLPSTVVCVSHSTADSISRRSKVVYNCLESLPGELSGRAAPIPLKNADQPFRYGVLGRLTPWKGQDVFLRAFAEAFPNGDESARLIGAPLFEEHEYEAELVALTSELGLDSRVEFRGFRSDVWDELSQLDALVHCSVIPEPFGQVVVEGLIAGLPVIATRDGGPGEIITDGVNGLLVPNSDTTRLAAALLRLRSDAELRGHLVEGARGSAARFGPDQYRRDMMAVYTPLLRRQPKASRA